MVVDNQILDALDALADITPEDYKEINSGTLREFIDHLLRAADATREELNQRKRAKAAQKTLELEH